MPRERSSSRRPHVRSTDRWRSGHRAGERRRRRSAPGERKHRSSRGRSKCRKREPGRSTASLAAERDQALRALRRQEIASRRMHQEKCERDRYQAQICRSVEAAVKTMERRCASQFAKLEQSAEAKLKELRAEVLREKLLRDADKRAANVAQEAAAKHKEKIGRLSAYLRLVAAPCAAKKELLEDATDAMPGVALDAAGAEVVASASAEAVGVASVSTNSGSESDEGSDGSASDDDGSSTSQKESPTVANTGTAQDAGEAPRASSPRRG